MLQQKILKFNVIFEEDPAGGYIAYAPSLSGCHTQGETLEEAGKNIKEAVEVYLESLNAHHEPIPQEETKVFLGLVAVAPSV